MAQTDLVATENLKVYSIDGYSFLIIEPLGNLQIEQYKSVLSLANIYKIIEIAKIKKVYLELNGIWNIGTDQQAWTVNEFQEMLSKAGISKMAIGLAERVYPTFKELIEGYEKSAKITTKYFDNLGNMSAWMNT